MVNLTNFGTGLVIQIIFLVFLVFMAIKNIRNNIGLWEKYGMILFIAIYLIFFIFFIVVHPIAFPIFEAFILSIVYLAVSGILTDFSVM